MLFSEKGSFKINARAEIHPARSISGQRIVMPTAAKFARYATRRQQRRSQTDKVFASFFKKKTFCSFLTRTGG
jgi:hypothetical protein